MKRTVLDEEVVSLPTPCICADPSSLFRNVSVLFLLGLLGPCRFFCILVRPISAYPTVRRDTVRSNLVLYSLVIVGPCSLLVASHRGMILDDIFLRHRSLGDLHEALSNIYSQFEIEQGPISGRHGAA